MPNLHVLIIQRSLLLPRNLALVTFGKLLIVFSTKVNLVYLLHSKAWKCCLLHLINQNCLLKAFLRTLTLMTQVSPYLFFLSGTNLKLHNISSSPRWLKMNLDLSKASGPDCIPVVVLKNCKRKLSYILAELFNKYHKDSCFPHC